MNSRIFVFYCFKFFFPMAISMMGNWLWFILVIMGYVNGLLMMYLISGDDELCEIILWNFFIKKFLKIFFDIVFNYNEYKILRPDFGEVFIMMMFFFTVFCGLKVFM